MISIAGEHCPLCGGKGEGVGIKDGVYIRRCCDVLLAWGWLSEAFYEDFYRLDNGYHDQQQIKEGQSTYWDRDSDLIAAAFIRLKMIQAFRPNMMSLVDIGAGTGAFVFAASRLGIDAIGYDINPRICDEAEAKGRCVNVGSFKSLTGEYGSVVTLNDVFEHLTRPVECLDHIRDVLVPSEVLYIEMPELDCPQHLRDGLRWKHIRPMQHIAIYSDQAARKLFKQCGFEVEFAFRPMYGTLGKIAYGLTKA